MKSFASRNKYTVLYCALPVFSKVMYAQEHGTRDQIQPSEVCIYVLILRTPVPKNDRHHNKPVFPMCFYFFKICTCRNEGALFHNMRARHGKGAGLCTTCVQQLGHQLCKTICVSPAFKDEDASLQPTLRNVGIHVQPVFKMADRM